MRKVTVRLASNCGSAFIHSPIYIQLSSGNFWIPPGKPLRFPPSGNVPSKGFPIAEVARGLQAAVTTAQFVGGCEIRDVSPITTHEHRGSRGQILSQAEVFEFSFTTLDDQVDFSHSGINLNGKTESKGQAQLLLSLRIGPGDEDFDVKPVDPLDCFIAGTNGGWGGEGRMPKDILKKKSRKHVKPEGDVYGDDTLFAFDPLSRRNAQCGWSPGAFWDPDGSADDWQAYMSGAGSGPKSVDEPGPQGPSQVGTLWTRDSLGAGPPPSSSVPGASRSAPDARNEP